MKRCRILQFVAAFVLCIANSMVVANPWIGQPYWDLSSMQAGVSSTFGSLSAEQTVSGYVGTFDDYQGLHNNDGSGYGMWLSAAGGGGGASKPSPSGSICPAWIAYDLGAVYDITDINIWNYNQNAGGGLGLGRGLKHVAIDVSVDAVDWVRVFEGHLNKATGLSQMPFTDSIACASWGRYVVINAFSHWNDDGSGDYYGLSEVRFNLLGPQAANPLPKDMALDTFRDLMLSWRMGLNAVKHDIYFGEDFNTVRDASITNPLGVYKGRQDAVNYNPGRLQTGQTYYWRVDEIDQNNQLYKGVIWDFTVDTGQSKNPNPTTNKIQQARDVILTWNKGLFASEVNGQDVYFGTDYDAVNDADLNSDEYRATQDAESFKPGSLLPDTQYCWRVDAINGSERWKGTVWCFKVRSITWDDFGILVQQWLNLQCDYPDWCDGADYDYGGNVDLADYVTFTEYWTQKPLRVMPVGDSITRGLTMGEWVPGGYRTRLYNRMAIELFTIDFVGTANDNPDPDNLPDPDHEGHGGYRIDQISDSITTWVTDAHPDIVLVHLGTNDVAQDYQLTTAPDRLDALISKIVSAEPQAHVLVANIITSANPAEASQIAAYNAAIPAIVSAYVSRREKVTMVDMNSDIGFELLYDVYHPNKAGYDKMADIWFEAIKGLYIQN